MLFDLIVHFSYPGVFLVLLAGPGVPIPEGLPIAIAALLARREVMHWAGALRSCLGGVLAGDMRLYPRFLLVDVAAVLLGVPLWFGVAYLVADSVAVALTWVRELQRWLAGLGLVAAAGWILAVRHRRLRGQTAMGVMLTVVS